MNTSPENPKEIVINCVPQEADSEMEIRMKFCFMTTTCGKEEAEARSKISKGRRDRWDADHGKEHEV